MSKVKSSISRRRRAREFVLQALFQWSINPMSAEDLCGQFLQNYDFSAADVQFFLNEVSGALAHVAESDELIAAEIPRPMDSMSLLIKSILRLAAYELSYCPEVPYKVVINEAVELQKSYGADEGRAFVNAVLDKLASKLRSKEYRSKEN